MEHALSSLLTSPRNNLRLFVDGERVPFGGKHATNSLSEDDWIRFLSDAVVLGEEQV
jgi:hypothetical protein